MPARPCASRGPARRLLPGGYTVYYGGAYLWPLPVERQVELNAPNPQSVPLPLDLGKGALNLSCHTVCNWPLPFGERGL